MKLIVAREEKEFKEEVWRSVASTVIVVGESRVTEFHS